MAAYTVEHPEDGFYWRLLGEDEVDLFQNPDAERNYGLTSREALTRGCRVLAQCQHLPADSRKILMGSSREYVLQWRRAKGGLSRILRVPKVALSDDCFEPLGPGVAVLGEAAVCHGELLELKDAQS